MALQIQRNLYQKSQLPFFGFFCKNGQTDTKTHTVMLNSHLILKNKSGSLIFPISKGMATHSSTLTWRIPRTEETGGLQSMGLQSRTQLSD